jgi:hypothetical protein
MWQCPRCNAQVTAAFCPSCGFAPNAPASRWQTWHFVVGGALAVLALLLLANQYMEFQDRMEIRAERARIEAAENNRRAAAEQADREYEERIREAAAEQERERQALERFPEAHRLDNAMPPPVGR